jgi:FkbH-like protein
MDRGGAFKLACVDCDNTLWFGVVGEDGPAGIVGNIALQERLSAAKRAGVLLVTVSKNAMCDVEAAFQAHPEWPLKLSDFVAHKVNWAAKSGNIADVVVELNLSTFASVVFIDDNPVEVAEVEARCTGIHALNVPSQPDESQHAAYASQMWPLDVFKSTREDALRMANFEQDGARQAQRSKTATFGEYIASLNVQVTLTPCADRLEEERVVQLSQRTNQFNLTTERLDAFPAPPQEVLVAKVSDKYGDYGIIGVIIFQVAGSELKLHNLMMSCRVLGRGVEQQMMSHIGRLAQQKGCTAVVIAFKETPRNEPAKHFLSENKLLPLGGKEDVSIPPAQVAGVVFDPDAAEKSVAAHSAGQRRNLEQGNAGSYTR